MSIQRERSPSIRSRQVLVKVSQVSKRLPQDFFAPKTLATSPKKRQAEDPPTSALQNWYDREDSEGKCQPSKVPARSKQISPVILLKHGDQPVQIKSSEREKYYQHLLDTMQKKQNIIFRAAKELKQEIRSRKQQKGPTEHSIRKRQSQERVIKSQGKRHRRLSHTPDKGIGVVREARLSLKELPRKGSSQGRYNNLNVGFDGLLTFNRFE